MGPPRAPVSVAGHSPYCGPGNPSQRCEESPDRSPAAAGPPSESPRGLPYSLMSSVRVGAAGEVRRRGWGPRSGTETRGSLRPTQPPAGRRGHSRLQLSLRFCDSVQSGAGTADPGPGWRRAASWGARAGTGGEAAKQRFQGPEAVSSSFQKQSRINPEDCHSFVSELFSPGKDTLVLSHAWKTCSVMKIHGGRGDRRGWPPHARGQGALHRGRETQGTSR